MGGLQHRGRDNPWDRTACLSLVIPVYNAASVLDSTLDEIERFAGFGFDIECLYVARTAGLSIRQTAVNFRYDDEPTTVRFARDSTRMLRDILHIKRNALRGRYRLAGGFNFPASDRVAPLEAPTQHASSDARPLAAVS